MVDYIDKNDLREYISGYVKSCNGKPTHTDMDAMVGIISLLEQMPAADVQPIHHGRWIECCNELDKKCSCCNKVHGTIYEREPFCPHCGARMDLKDGDIK